MGVCDKVHAGTDSPISVEITSKGVTCNTGHLDKHGNDYERGDWMEFHSHEIHEDCRELDLSTYDLKVAVINHGSDALCLDRYICTFRFLSEILSEILLLI